MTKNSTRSNGNPAPLPSRLKDYYSLLKMKRQIMASSNALDGLDTDTVHAIAASLPSGRTEGNIALSVIGGKLSVKSANPDSQTRTARRRVRGLVQAQARGLVLFIEVTPGGRRADGLDNPHHYRDHLSPAANEAWEVFLRRCQQEDWKALSGAQRNQEFKRIALEALNPLRLYGPPAPAPAPTPTDRKAAPLKLKPVDYAIEQERKQLDSIQSTLNQLLLADEEQALSYLKHLRESVTVIYHQTLRTARNETRGGEPSELSPLPDMSPTLVYPPPASRDPLSEIEPLPAPAPAPAPAVHTSREGGGDIMSP